MTAVVVTPSLDPSWIGPMAGLRGRGVGALVCLVDPVAHEEQSTALRRLDDPGALGEEARARDVRALRHALAEHDIPSFLVDPVHSLGEQLLNAPTAGREAAA
jgi:hypothetical protein